jgi:hypothetical protein
MRRRDGDLGMDKGTYCLDTAKGPSRIPQEWILMAHFHIYHRHEDTGQCYGL